LTAYAQLSLVTGFLATITGVMRKHHHRLDASIGAPGPLGFAVRKDATRLIGTVTSTASRFQRS
jgi:hypothetical protein